LLILVNTVNVVTLLAFACCGCALADFLNQYRLEEQQREEKRKREARQLPFTPRWFRLTGDIAKTPWDDHLEIYEFTGDYKKWREETAQKQEPANTDQESIVFNPW
jgi:hypothetical protein